MDNGGVTLLMVIYKKCVKKWGSGEDAACREAEKMCKIVGFMLK